MMLGWFGVRGQNTRQLMLMMPGWFGPPAQISMRRMLMMLGWFGSPALPNAADAHNAGLVRVPLTKHNAADAYDAWLGSLDKTQRS